jgi:hypothetical protein
MVVHGTGVDFVGRMVLDVPAPNPIFSFDSIARALTDIVKASEPRFAVGIFGGWGSGKSTLMDTIREHIKPDAVVVDFNAWRYERETHLMVPLLETIRAGLAQWALGDRSQRDEVLAVVARIGRVIRGLVRATKFEIGLPGAVKLSVDTATAVDAITDGDDSVDKPESVYFAAFKELDDAFNKVRDAGVPRIVVFVDDLDRCLPESALAVLESMKLFFDTKGFVFIVGLDERVVQSAVRSKFRFGPDVAEDIAEQLEQEYLNKIFQLPYTLPKIAPAQLNELMRWLDDNAGLGDEQRIDLHNRVRHYLSYVAREGRVNPREVKRYINAYTLQRMIRPELNPDTILALQTMDFRADWEQFYAEIVLAEPDVFVEILRSFRNHEDIAFEDVWPDVGVLSVELSEFLRSPLTGQLASEPSLERYLSSVETTQSTQPWVQDAMRDVGRLRNLVRNVDTDVLEFGSPRARTFVEDAVTILGRLESNTRMYSKSSERVTTVLEKLRSRVQALGAPTEKVRDDNSAPGSSRIEKWKVDAAGEVDTLQRELRLIRRASAIGPRY